MAVGALGAPFPAMHVIRGMTGHALRGRSFVSITEMTLGASDTLVLVVQREPGSVVIECHVLPDLRVVAVSAIPPQLAFVRLLGLVADGAFVRGGAEGFLRLVTALARHVEVRAVQWKVGSIVVELLAAQFDDVGVSALMLGVTCAALCRLDSPQPAVKPGVCADVLADFLVTAGA
jgi:hypothetical protein